MGSGRRGWALGVVAALLWAAAGATAAPPEQQRAHLFSEVLFCQRDSPFSGLAQTLDGQALFGFDFPGSRWLPRLPDFRPEAPGRTPLANVSRLNQLCGEALRALTALAEDERVQTPEARGIPQVEVFTLQPLQLGQPNTLVCSVTNLFPPSADISWEHGGELVTEGVSTPQTYPVQGLDFRAFSYLEVTPQEGDVYSCTVRTARDKFSSMAFWVPKDPIASDLAVTIACGIAVGLGGVFMIVGVALIVGSCMLRTAE
ncbi:HLA class II histocompatibility antigen, DM alpha chain isoform X2 [Tiliqua scincoides]|uniref:HLA class II histocompatibility antigen, DM alpha chain isoform X2 n=1 Tax=Tiliqua scincoides TaxID=71010 RepID=UPI0034632DA5